MKTNKFNIEECGLAKSESKDLIFKILNNQIRNCKAQYFSEWERDHSTTSEVTDAKIAALKEKKREIEAFFQDCSENESCMDVNISIELKVKEKVLESTYA